MPKYVLIVDDHEAVRRAIRSRFQADSQFIVCGEAVDGIDAIEKSQECLAPEFLDSELSVFMQRLRAQGAAGEPGRA